MRTEQARNPHEHDGVVNTLEAIEASQVFGTDEGRQAFLRELTSERLITWLGAIQESLVFDKSTVFRGPRSKIVRSAWRDRGTAPESSLVYLAPDHATGRDLLKEVVHTARQLQDTRQAATLLGLGISAIHPMHDGNGRSGRVLYGLLTRGYKGDDADRDFYRHVSSHAGRESLYLSPVEADLPAFFLAQWLIDAGDDHPRLFYKPDRAMNWDWGLYRRLGAPALYLTLEEPYFGLIPLIQAARQKGLRPTEYTTTMPPGIARVQIERIFPDPQEVNALALSETEAAVKTAYVRAIIGCFRPSEPSPLRTADELTQLYGQGPAPAAAKKLAS